MNKKILTLLAAGFMGNLSVSAFATTAPVMTPGKLHQLTTSAGVLSMVDRAGQDSLAVVTGSNDVMSEAFKRSLWSIDSTNVDNSTEKVYTFTNYYTKKVLSMNLSKETAIIATPGQSAWLIDAATGALSAIKNGVTYEVGTHLSGELVACKDGTATQTQFDIAPATVSGRSTVDLKVDQINGQYGTPTSLTFGSSLQGNPLEGAAFTVDLAEPTASTVDSTLINIRLTNGQYMVVGTAKWNNSAATGDFWKLTTDAKSVAVGDTSAVGVSVLKNGRTEEVYQFKMTLDIQNGYKLNITPKAVPAKVGFVGFRYGNASSASKKISWAQFANSVYVMYATANAQEKAVTAEFGVISSPSSLSENYVYYVQNWNTYLDPTTPNRDGYKKYVYVMDTKTQPSNDVSSSLQIPAYMWYLKASQMKNMSVDPTLTNGPTEGTEQRIYTGSIKLIDETEGIYAFGSDTLKLTKGPKIADAQKMAYRKVSDEDLINGALSFRLVSVLANDLYVMENSADNKMVVANGELADALRFKTLDVTPPTSTEGNDLIRPVYLLWDRTNQKVLAHDGTNYKWADPSVTPIPTPVAVSFYATGAEDEYKIVYVNGSFDKAITANAATGILEETDRDNDALVKFQFAKKDAPMYGSPKFGHVQITTLEDDDKMIAPQLDGFAALKAEGQILKSAIYTNDSLKLYLDTAYVREGVNYYYLASTAFTTFNKADIQRNYLINPANRYDELVAASVANGYLFDVIAAGQVTYRAAFEPAKRIGEAKDSLAIFEHDTLSASNKYYQPLNPAAVAFEVVVDEGDEVYNIVSKLAVPAVTVADGGTYDPDQEASNSNNPAGAINEYYLAQLNNVLFWAQDQNLAEKFVINRTTAPTANEAVEAETVKVIGGQGVVTVQGAAGKVVTVANILGQTIANQVAASDNVTIAAPAGIVVVSVDGEATKVIVK